VYSRRGGEESAECEKRPQIAQICADWGGWARGLVFRRLVPP
jgi:hypothetical protein